jgi:acyl-CoA thioesterase
VTTFEAATAIAATAPGRYAVAIPDGWQQGRGAFGGLVLGMLLRAIEHAAAGDAGRRTRTLLGDLVGPALPGAAEIRVELLRRGANQSNLRADLVQGGDTVAYASAVLSTPRPVGLPGFAPRVEPPAFDTAVALVMRPGAPTFTQHLEYRLTGSAPWTAAATPDTAGWVRFREPPRAVDAPLLIALLDAFWPAYFSTVPAPRPIATVSFAAQIACDPRALDPAAPLFYRARTVNDHDGFQLELRELFDPSGAVVAMNQQTFAILK